MYTRFAWIAIWVRLLIASRVLAIPWATREETEVACNLCGQSVYLNGTGKGYRLLQGTACTQHMCVNMRACV